MHMSLNTGLYMNTLQKNWTYSLHCTQNGTQPILYTFPAGPPAKAHKETGAGFGHTIFSRCGTDPEKPKQHETRRGAGTGQEGKSQLTSLLVIAWAIMEGRIHGKPSTCSRSPGHNHRNHNGQSTISSPDQRTPVDQKILDDVQTVVRKSLHRKQPWLLVPNLFRPNTWTWKGPNKIDFI